MLSQTLLPILRDRYPQRGLIESPTAEPFAVFPGIHPGIRSVSIYDDGHEVTLCVDELTHGHFSEYTEGLSDAQREARIIDSVVEFLDALFADRVVVWGEQHSGGWYRPEYRGAGSNTVVPAGRTGRGALVHEFVWSGPYPQGNA